MDYSTADDQIVLEGSELDPVLANYVEDTIGYANFQDHRLEKVGVSIRRNPTVISSPGTTDTPGFRLQARR